MELAGLASALYGLFLRLVDIPSWERPDSQGSENSLKKHTQVSG